MAGTGIGGTSVGVMRATVQVGIGDSVAVAFAGAVVAVGGTEVAGATCARGAARPGNSDAPPHKQINTTIARIPSFVTTGRVTNQ